MRHVVADLGPRRLYLLGLLGALKAAGLILVAQGVADALAALAAHGDGWRAAAAVGAVGVLLRAAAAWALQVVSAATAAHTVARMRGRVLRRAILSSPARHGTGALTTLATTALDELDRYYTVFLPTLVGAATVPLIVGARILFADWVSAAVIVVTVPLIPVFMILIGLRTREAVGAATTALERLGDHLVELARGLPVLVGLGRGADQEQALRELSEKHRRASMSTLRVAFLSALALELISTLSVAVVAVFVGLRLVAGDLSLSAGLIALVLAPECYAPFRDIGAAFHASQSGLEARERVQSVLAEPVARHELVRRTTAAGAAVSGLTVRHPNRPQPVVASLSFRAAPGCIVAVEGASGTGKTTVLDVLAGRGALLEPDADVTGVLEVPATVAWLPQHPHVSEPTARAELERYGATDAPAILARLGLDALAEAAPARLSPGEQRRLAFGRVLARVEAGAALAILDEPTAHLDERSAALVRSEIAALRGRATVVLASHDPALRALADATVPLSRVPASAPAASPASADAPAAARPDSAAAAADGSSWRELLAFLGPVRGRMLLAAVTGAAAALFAVALTAVSGWLIVRAAEHPPILYLMVAIVGVRFFGIGRAVLRYADRLATHDAVFAALTGLRVRLWRGLAAQGPSGRAALTPGNTLDRLVGDADAARDLAPRVLLPPVAAVIASAAAVAGLWLLEPLAGLTLLAAVATALLGGVAAALAADRRASRLRDLERSRTLRLTAGLLAARDELAANGAAEGALRDIHRTDASAAANARRTAAALGGGGAIVVAALGAAAFAMLPVSAAAVVPAPVAAVFVLTPLALVDPLLDAVAAVQRWGALRQVLARVAGVTASVVAPSGEKDIARVGQLALVDAAYRYPGARDDAFAHVTAQTAPGDWLAVTGPSGSGKSTLLALLLRYLDPVRGRYELDGEDARLLDPAAVRRRISWCPQEGHLFNSTLRGNLVIARPRSDVPDDAELLAALDRAGLGLLVAELPLGLDTPIGAEGSFLSGGQRQRVAVARTLLARSDAVLLDEPTAHLDEEASAQLLTDLRTALRGRTVVLVTHDEAAARFADLQLELGARSQAAVVPAL